MKFEKGKYYSTSKGVVSIHHRTPKSLWVQHERKINMLRNSVKEDEDGTETAYFPKLDLTLYATDILEEEETKTPIEYLQVKSSLGLYATLPVVYTIDELKDFVRAVDIELEVIEEQLKDYERFREWPEYNNWKNAESWLSTTLDAKNIKKALRLVAIKTIERERECGNKSNQDVLTGVLLKVVELEKELGKEIKHRVNQLDHITTQLSALSKKLEEVPKNEDEGSKALERQLKSLKSKLEKEVEARHQQAIMLSKTNHCNRH